MKTKEKVLRLLHEHSGEYISGQYIADKIYVTRACIWKSIKSLQNDGYTIDAVTNKGYRLIVQPDIIDVNILNELFLQSNINLDVHYYDEVSSTNDIARELSTRTNDNLLVISSFQTKGRGRRGRTFYSPKDTGLYMSLLIRSSLLSSSSQSITAKTAVAVSKAIDDILGEDKTQIKWVNDIYINNKKVAGILTEAFSLLEDAESSCIIIGIGLNLYPPKDDFPKDIKDLAGFIMNAPDNANNIKNTLIYKITTYFFNYYSETELIKKECIDIYREKSFLINQYIKINNFKDSYKYAQVTGINDEYHLCVTYDDGEKDVLSSGEVSVVKY